NGLKLISDMSHISILADEAVFTLGDAKKVMESCSAHMINIKLMKCGGVTKAIEILEYARKNSITCMLGSMLEGPHSINIALYLAMAYRDVIKYIDLDSPLLYKEPSSELDFEFKGCKISLKK
ncbi:MAG: dipeptide epimerase, partial [Sulfurimonas sp.]|nr:dipeptide epimerase [Sulfurimonas sp.]